MDENRVQEQKVIYNTSGAVRNAEALSRAFNEQAAAMREVLSASRDFKDNPLAANFASAAQALKRLSDLEESHFDKAKAKEKELTAIFKSELQKREAKIIELNKKLSNTRKGYDNTKDIEARATAQLAADNAVRVQREKNIGVIEAQQIKSEESIAAERLKIERATLTAQNNLEVQELKNRGAQSLEQSKEANRIRREEASKTAKEEARLRKEQENLFKNSLSSQIKASEERIGAYNKQLQRARGTFTDLASSAGVFGNAIKAVFIFGAASQFTNELKNAVTQAADLSVKLSEVQTISQRINENGQSFGTIRTTQALAEDVRKISDAYNLTQLDVVEGLYEAISNQVSGAAENMNFLSESARFAKSATTDLNTSVELLSATLNSYDLAVSRTSEVSAKWFRAIELGRFRAEELSQDIGRSAVLANQLGIDLDQLAASYATMTVQGVKFANAQTFLTNIMLKLIKPTEEMREILDSWGVTSGKAAIEAFGLNGVLARLDDEAKKGADRLGELGEQFSTIRAIIGATILGNKADLFDDNLIKITQAQEAFNAAYQLRVENSGEILQREMNQVKNFFISDIGTNIVENLARFSKGTADLSDSFKDLARIVFAAIPAYAAFNLATKTTQAIMAAVLIAKERDIVNTIRQTAATNADTAATQANTAAKAVNVGAAATAAKGIGAVGTSLLAIGGPLGVAAAVGFGIYTLIDALDLLGSEAEDSFERLSDAATKSTELVKTASVKTFQDASDQISRGVQFITTALIDNEVAALASVNAQINELTTSTKLFQGLLVSAFKGTEVELNRQIFTLKNFDDVIDRTQKRVSRLAEEYNSYTEDLTKNYGIIEKAIDSATESLADFNKEFLVSKQSPASITGAVSSAKAEDELSKITTIENVKERIEKLISEGNRSASSGLSLFDNNKVEEGNDKIQTAVDLISKAKQEIIALRKENPEDALGLPTPEELTRRLESYNQQINQRAATIQSGKVFSLLTSSDADFQETLGLLSRGESDKAAALFKQSQSTYQEAFNIAQELADNPAATGIPGMEEFRAEFENRTATFIDSARAVQQAIAKTEADNIRALGDQSTRELITAQDELFKSFNEVAGDLKNRDFVAQVKAELDRILAAAEDFDASYQQIAQQVEQGFLAPEIAGKQIDALSNKIKALTDETKANNEEINNQNREQLALQKQVEQIYTNIGERQREMITLAGKGDPESLRQYKLLHQQTLDDFDTLQRTGLEVDGAAREAAQRFMTGLEESVSSTGAKLDELFEKLESVAGPESTKALREALEAQAVAIGDPAAFDRVQKAYKTITESGSLLAASISDEIKIVASDYLDYSNSTAALQENFNAILNNEINLKEQIIRQDEELLGLKQQEIELSRKQNEAINYREEVSRQLKKSEDLVASSEDRKKQFIDGINALDAAVTSMGLEENLRREIDSYGTGKALPGEIDRRIAPSQKLEEVLEPLTALRLASASLTAGKLSVEEFTQFANNALTPIREISELLTGELQRPDLQAAIQEVARLVPTTIIAQDVLGKTITEAFDPTRSLANREGSLNLLATGLEAAAKATNVTAENAAELNALVPELRDLKNAVFNASSNDALKSALEKVQEGLTAFSGDDVRGVAGLIETNKLSVEAQSRATTQLEELNLMLRDAGLAETDANQLLQTAAIRDERRNELLEVIRQNTNPDTQNKLALDLAELLADGAVPVQRASGGYVPKRKDLSGYGTDTVLAALTPGEYVIKQSAAQALGPEALSMINQGMMPAFADGGPVTALAHEAYMRQLKEGARSLLAQELAKKGKELDQIYSMVVDPVNDIVKIGSYSAKSTSTLPGFEDRTSDDYVRKVFSVPVSGRAPGIGIFPTGGSLAGALAEENDRIATMEKAKKLEAIGMDLFKSQLGGATLSNFLTTQVDTNTGMFRVLGFGLTKGTDLFASSTEDVQTEFDLSKYLSRLAKGGYAKKTLAALTPGEFVVGKEAAQALGTNALNSLNSYARGGRVKVNGEWVEMDINPISPNVQAQIDAMNAREAADPSSDYILSEIDAMNTRKIAEERLTAQLDQIKRGYVETGSLHDLGQREFGERLTSGIVELFNQPQYDQSYDESYDESYDQSYDQSYAKKRGRVKVNGQWVEMPASNPENPFLTRQDRFDQMNPEDLKRLYGKIRYERLYGPGSFYLAEGGHVGGPKGTDTVPAWLTPGEFVVNAKSAEKFAPLLTKINRDQSVGPYYSDGGLIGSYTAKAYTVDSEKASASYIHNNEINLNAVGSEAIDANRMLFYINRGQRLGTGGIKSRRTRVY